MVNGLFGGPIAPWFGEEPDPLNFPGVSRGMAFGNVLQNAGNQLRSLSSGRPAQPVDDLWTRSNVLQNARNRNLVDALRAKTYAKSVRQQMVPSFGKNPKIAINRQTGEKFFVRFPDRGPPRVVDLEGNLAPPDKLKAINTGTGWYFIDMETGARPGRGVGAAPPVDPSVQPTPTDTAVPPGADETAPAPSTAPVTGLRQDVSGAAYEGEMGKMNAKAYGQIMDTSEKARNNLFKYQTLQNALAGADPGLLGDWRLWGRRLGAELGIDVDTSKMGQAQMSKVLSNQLALVMRNPAGGEGMPGHLSDKDLQFLKESVPSLLMSPEGIKVVMDYMIRAEQRKLQIAEMADDFAASQPDGRFNRAKFKRHIRQWVKDNPLFVPSGKGDIPANAAMPPTVASERSIFDEYDDLER